MYAVNFVFVLVCGAILFGHVLPSAIPMWEYLTHDEKIMYLYNMFQVQVKDFCETNTCKQELRNYGWNKLKEMPEDHLDKMDPFQRGSNDLIWESVMEGHEMLKTTRKPKLTSTARPNDVDESFGDEENSDTSANIEATNKVPPPKGFSVNYYTIEVGEPEYKIQYTSYPSSNRLQDATTEGFPIIESYGEYQRIPLTGPMVFKVHPDGTPVKDDNQTLPEDDDLKQYKMTKTVFQSL